MKKQTKKIKCENWPCDCKDVPILGATHTPGPWKVKPLRSEGELVFNIQTVNDIDEVFIAQTCGGISPLEGEANARLIAAAPELLDVLKWWQSRMGDDACNDMALLLEEMSSRVDNAINKAEGN